MIRPRFIKPRSWLNRPRDRGRSAAAADEPNHHFAHSSFGAESELLEKMMEKRITGISFENLKDDSGSYPIVRSMSEIAGSAVMLVAAQYLGSANHGKGVLLGGISGVPPTKVIILGAGIVGEYAARAALALGASVKVFDNSVYRLKATAE